MNPTPPASQPCPADHPRGVRCACGSADHAPGSCGYCKAAVAEHLARQVELCEGCGDAYLPPATCCAPAPVPDCLACDGDAELDCGSAGWRICSRCGGTGKEMEGKCPLCGSWHAADALVLSPECDDAVCRPCGEKLAWLGFCTVAGCTNVAAHVCASCDAHRCHEHASFSTEADEWFCALTPEAYRQGRTITYCAAGAS